MFENSKNDQSNDDPTKNVRKRIKLMSSEEKKEYNRIKKQKERKTEKQQSAISRMFGANTKFNELSPSQKTFYKKTMKRERESENYEPKLSKKPKTSTIGEKENILEEERDKQPESRESSDEHLEQSMKIVQNFNESENGTVPDFIGSKNKNVLVRFSQINLFDTEVDTVIIPYFQDPDVSKIPKGSIHQQFKKLIETDEDFPTINLPSNFNNFEFQVLSSSTMEFCVNNNFMLVRSPVACEKKGFTISTETELKATYFRILHQCDSHEIKSVSIPLLGTGFGKIDSKRSLIIGLQAVFAYFSSVQQSNIELVYFCVRNKKKYFQLGEVLLYNREFDLSKNSPAECLKFIDTFMRNIKTKGSYMKFPGTQLRLRTFKSTFTLNQMRISRKISKTVEKLTEMKGKRLENVIGVTDNIDHSIFETHPVTINHSQLDITPSTSELISELVPIPIKCLKYENFRQVWILSRYYCFYSGSEPGENLSSYSAQRKKWFLKLKDSHLEWVKNYYEIKFSNNKRCSCGDDGHNNFQVFGTRMSHYDKIMEEWFLKNKSLYFVEGQDGIRFLVAPKTNCKQVEVFDNTKEAIEMKNRKILNDEFNCHEFILNENDSILKFMEDAEISTISTMVESVEFETTGLGSKENSQENPHEKQMERSKLEKFKEHISNSFQREVQMRNRMYAKEYFGLAFLEKHAPNTIIQYLLEEVDDTSIDQEMIGDISYVWQSISEGNYSEPEFELWPLFNLGPRDSLCSYCGSYGFRNEKNRKCCLNGAIWIPPFKKLPEVITKLYENRNYRSIIININAVHAMASTVYNREVQELHGVQSIKVKGQINLMASALIANNPEKPAFGNFIVLNATDERVAEKRLQTLFKQYKGLKEIFVELKRYMDKNNQFVHLFKSMMELLEQADRRGENWEKLNFRIVHTDEIKKFDLEQHKGVYADPSRMNDDFVSVAFSMDHDMNIKPRGMTIYAKNPKGFEQLPLSIYDEKAPPMAYPLHFPNGETGFTLKKYKRFDKKEIMLFEDRIKLEIENIESRGENPEHYFDGQTGTNNIPIVTNTSDIPENCNDDIESDFESENEECSNEADVLENIDLDDLQNEQRSFGKRPKVIFVERDGEMYPVRNGDEIIPFVSDSDRSPDVEIVDEHEFLNDEELDKLQENNCEFEEHVIQTNENYEESNEELDEFEHVALDDFDDSEITAENRGNGGVRVMNKGKRKFVSAAEYYSFIFKNRKHVPCRFLGISGKLGQLFVIDAFSKVQQMRMDAITRHRAMFQRSTKKSTMWKYLNKKMRKYFKNELGKGEEVITEKLQIWKSTNKQQFESSDKIFYSNLEEFDDHMPILKKIAKINNQKQITKRLTMDGDIITESLEFAEKTAAETTRTIKGMVHKTTAAIKAGIEETWWNLKAFVLWIILPIVAGTFSLIICCQLLKCYCTGMAARRAAKSAKESFFNHAASKLLQINQIEPSQELTLEEAYPMPDLPEINNIDDDINNVDNKTGKLPFLRIRMNGKRMKCLLDSGSCLSLISKSRLEEIGGQLKNDIKETARAANSTLIQFCGQTDLKITVDGISFMQNFRVLDGHNPNQKIILGMDFMEKLAEYDKTVTFDLKKNKRTVTIGDTELDINNIEPQESQEYQKVVTTSETIIPKRSESIISVKVKPTNHKQTTVIIEDDHHQSRDIYTIARSIGTTTKDGQTVLRICNPSNKEIKFHKGKTIAKATIIGSSSTDINEIQEESEVDLAFKETQWWRKLPKISDPTEIFNILEKVDVESAELSSENKEKLRQLILNKAKAFTDNSETLGRYTGNVKHKIPLIPGYKIPKGRTPRIPLARREEIRKQIDKMIQQGIIRPSDSPFNSPLVLVRKKDNSWRFCQDFRQLNDITVPASTILPHMNDILDLIGNKTWYTTLDLTSGYYQIPLEEDHCERTAFSTAFGTFEYVRMPMGLRYAGSTFQRVMDSLIRTCRATCSAYLDDLIIASDSEEQHLQDIEELLNKIIQAGLKISPKKANLAKSKVEFLGVVLSKNGIQPSSKKTQAIRDYPPPTNENEVRRFMGMINFFRKFIPKCALIAAPINELLRNDKEFIWTEECQNSFETLKQKLMEEPILATPILGAPFEVEVDASKLGVGAVLYQCQPGNPKDRRTIMYASKKHSATEQRYAAIEIESGGMVWALTTFQPYIDGSETTVYTDHMPLKSIITNKTTSNRLQKFQISLQSFNIKIQYKKGCENVVADALSRGFSEQSHSESFEHQVNMIEEEGVHKILNQEAVRKEQKHPEILKLMDECQEVDYTGANGKIEGILYMLPLQETDNPKIILPSDSTVARKLIQLIHRSKYEASHQGIRKTLHRVKDIIKTPNLQQLVTEEIRQCRNCQQNKDPHQYRIITPLGTTDIVNTPFEKWSSDVLGPLPLTINGNRYIIVFCCAFTKLLVAEASPDITARTTAKVFMDRIFARFGTPRIVTTDKGSNYTSKEFIAMLELLGVKHQTSTPAHHQSNGQVERNNQSLEQILRQMINNKTDSWDEELQLAIFAYNSTVQASTKFTPNELIYGRSLPSPCSIALQQPVRRYCDEDDYVERIKANLQFTHRATLENIQKARESQKQNYTRHNPPTGTIIAIGDQVLVRTARTNKISSLFSEPMTVVATTKENVTVNLPRTHNTRNKEAKTWTVHKDRCKKFVPDSN